MLTTIAIIFFVIVAIIGIYRHHNESTMKKNVKPDKIFENKMKTEFIAFKDNNFFIPSYESGAKPLSLKLNVFMNLNNKIYIPNLRKNIDGLKPDQVNQAVDYAVSHGGKTAKAAFALTAPQTLADKLGLNDVNTTLCISDDEPFFFSNDPQYKPYRVLGIDFNSNYKTSYHTKTKGRSGSALVGGLVAGPVGAMIGGSRGKKSTTTSTEKEVPSRCHVHFEDPAHKEYVLPFLALSKQVSFLEDHFLYSKEFENSNDVHTDNVDKLNADSSNDDSVADKLRNLKSLLDDGIITQEDFDAKKKQLLGL